MFGIRFFDQQGKDNYSTPTKFTEKARKDINEHLKNLDVSKNKKLLQQNLKYGSSPLRNNIFSSSTNNSNTNITPVGSVSFSSINNNNTLTQQPHSQANDDAISISSDNSETSNASTSSNSSRKKFLKLFSSNSNKSNKVSSSSAFSIASSSGNSIRRDSDSSSIHTQYSTMNNESLFSNPLSLIYTASTLPTITEDNNNDFIQLPPGYIKLEDALPSNYNDMYSPDLITERFSNGRPIFTRRNLKDWEINDIRSLLIQTDFKESNTLPEIVNNKLYNGVKFRLILLPLNSSDQVFIETLVHSDIYIESNFSLEFRYKTAKYIVDEARIRHANILIENYQVPQNYFQPDGNLITNINDLNNFSKFEWRNIIDNFLLNLAVENQCRFEFKQNCQVMKRQKLKIFNDLNHKSSSTLLAQAILNSTTTTNNLESSPTNNKSVNVKLSDDERRKIWDDVQQRVYHSLNLDWHPEDRVMSY